MIKDKEMLGIRLLLIFFPIALFAKLAEWNGLTIFAASALAIVPLAGILGEATNDLAKKTGPRIGGLLNASLGNAAELIITLVAIRAAEIELARASITGSILGNLLFVLGFSMFLGGIKNGIQKFERHTASIDSTMTILVVIAISVPSLFSHYIEPNRLGVEELSLTTAGAMMALYLLSIVYTLRSKSDRESEAGTGINIDKTEPAESPGSLRKIILLMAFATIGIAIMSELLVGSVEVATKALGLTKFFIGIIIVPIIGNVSEHLISVQAARRNQMDLSLSIALGSSLQIALFVTPLIVFISLLLRNPLTLEFNNLELIALTGASFISALVSLDGESNWLEGAMLIVVYGILGLAFFFLPSSVI
ncbi:MAG: calcium/proton exchanger [Methanotrichaceae archaeon]